MGKQLTKGKEPFDQTNGNRWLRLFLPAFVLGTVALITGGLDQPFYAFWFAGLAIGVIWRGEKWWFDGADPTYEVRGWVRSKRVRIGAAAWWALWMVYGVAVGWSQSIPVVHIVMWVAGTLGVAAAVAALYLRPATHAPRQKIEIDPTEEAIKRLDANGGDRAMLIRAGLGIKSSVSGAIMAPETEGMKFDHTGNPVLVVRPVPGAQTLDTFTKKADQIRSSWGGLLRVMVKQSPDSPDLVEITGVTREFQRSEPVLWKPMDVNTDVLTYLSALPVGQMYDSTEEVVMDLRQTNETIGGVPGSGKSSYINAKFAHLVRHPAIQCAMSDMKDGMEARQWEDGMSAAVSTREGSLELIRWLREELRRRTKLMKSVKWTDNRGRERIGITNAWDHPGVLCEQNPVIFAVFDEVSELWASKGRDGINPELVKEDLASLVKLGRAAGIVVSVATQRPTEESLPTIIRSQTTIRMAFKQMEATGAVATLGQSWADEHYSDPVLSPVKIAKEQRGQAIVDLGQDGYARVQMAYVSPEDVYDVIEEVRHRVVKWGVYDPDDEPDTEPEPDPATYRVQQVHPEPPPAPPEQAQIEAPAPPVEPDIIDAEVVVTEPPPTPQAAAQPSPQAPEPQSPPTPIREQEVTEPDLPDPTDEWS